MGKNVVVMLAAVAALSLAGCKEKVHTVEWFVEHKAEREAQLVKCHSNPGEMAKTPNCINATRAVNALILGGLFAPLSPPPVNTEDNNK